MAVPIKDHNPGKNKLRRETARTLTVVFSTSAFLAVLNTEMISPLAPAMSSDLGVPVALVGGLVSAAGLSGLIVALATGPLSDSYGRRPLLLTGAIAVALGGLGAALAPNYVTLIFVRLIAGGGSALLWSNLLAGVGDYFPQKARGYVVGNVLTATGLSMMLGWPLIAGIADLLNWRWSFLAFSLIAAVATIALAVAVPPEVVSRNGGRGFAYVKMYRDLLKSKPVLATMSAGAVGAAYWFGFITYLGAFLANSFPGNPMQTLGTFALVGLGYTVGGFLGGHLERRWGGRRLAAIMIAVSGLCVGPITIGLLTFLPVAFLLVGFSTARAMGMVGLESVLLRIAPTSRGTLIAMNSASFRMGLFAGTALNGVILAELGFTLIGPLSTALAILSALILVLAVPGEALKSPNDLKTR